MSWQSDFDDRQKTEIEFSRVYESKFNHGTDGHNAKLIIARMALLLDEAESRVMDLVNEVLSTDRLPNEKHAIYLAHKLMEIFK